MACQTHDQSHSKSLEIDALPTIPQFAAFSAEVNTSMTVSLGTILAYPVITHSCHYM